MKFISLSVLSIILSFSVNGQKKIEYVEYDLPNGLHVIIHEEHATPIVAVSILYHVGSKNENPDRTGFAHFFEHLLFEGSTNIGRGEYSELVEKNGGALNANTSQDRTYYYELLPSNQLELGLWLESERLFHAKVDNTGIETQRSVVKEEKRQRIDNQPYASFISEMFKRMFTVLPYNWAVIGSMEHLDAAQEEDYVNFYKTFYVPANATLSIAGDLNVEETKKWIAKYFGSIPAGQAINLYRDFENLSDGDFQKRYGVAKSVFDAKDFMNSKSPEAKKLIAQYAKLPVMIPRPEKDKEVMKSVIQDTIYDNIQLPAIFMGYRFPNQTSADSYALEMMNEVLSGGSSSRINKAVVEKKQLATFAFSFNYGLEDAGVGIFAAIAADKVPLDSIQVEFDAQINRMKTELISQEEFEKVRNKFENNFVSSNATIAGVAENLANYHVYYGTANRANTEIENYMKVTREDILRVANTYLTQNARVILYYLPKEN
ncbi:MAG: insulinase family protein [Cryomorphaceae bacterium]|nr:insulinase family protein [Cryomorphaceae bacterium]